MPDCLAAAPIHDHQERQWRHLDTCQFKTFVHARVPRLNCPTHSIRQLTVPWGEPGSQFTALFEVLAIDWLKQASVSAVAKHLRISWDEADGVRSRAVRRGLARPDVVAPRYVGIDETAFQKRHEYVTVVSDLERGIVVDVADDRKTESLDALWESLSPGQIEDVEALTMDMWGPYILHVRAPAGRRVKDRVRQVPCRPAPERRRRSRAQERAPAAAGRRRLVAGDSSGTTSCIGSPTPGQRP